jgi:hypothetical protein
MRTIMLAAVVAVLAPAIISAGAIASLVTVNTSAISGTSGFLDFDFAPGNNSQSAFVTIDNFSPGAALAGVPQVSGGVTGNLPGTLTIDNSTQFNDYFQAFNYGISIQFLLTLDGPALTSPDGVSTSGSTFAFGMFDSTGSNPLLTTDSNGNTFTVDVNLDGSTTITTFPSDGNGGPPAATVVAETPEPSYFLLVALLLAGMWWDVCNHSDRNFSRPPTE